MTPAAGSAARLNQPCPPSAASDAEELRAHVLEGLSRTHRELSPKYFYDDAGAALFDRICTVDEYYLTRTETGIHTRNAWAIAKAIGPGARVVEFGSGSGSKTMRLLRTLRDPAAYVPIDICLPQLQAFAAQVAREFPAVDVDPVWADFSAPFELPPPNERTIRTVAMYHGSTIGNLHPDEAQRFLERVATACGPDGGLLVGVDRAKDRTIIEPAYNDAAGVTAAFNRNVLRRINRECGANFDPDAFEHAAFYDEGASRIEMRLVSARDQVVSIPTAVEGQIARFAFARGDFITTEYSCKYRDEAFSQLVCRAGWTVERVWTDDRGWFGVWLLRVAARG